MRMALAVDQVELIESDFRLGVNPALGAGFVRALLKLVA